MTEFKKWVALKAAMLLIVSLAMLLPPVLHAEATVIKDLRIGSYAGYVRMVLEFDRSLTPSPSISIDGNVLQVNLMGIEKDLSVPRPEEYGDDIVSLDVSNASAARRIEVVYSFDPANVDTFSLTDPHRFIIDAFRSVTSDAAGVPVDTAPQIPSNEASTALPEPGSQPEKSSPADDSRAIADAPMDAGASIASNNHTADDVSRSRLRQGLIAALIVATSIIAVLLFLLIWVDSGQKKRRDSSWTDHLPPSKDQHIERLDSEVRQHLNADLTKMELTIDRQVASLVEVVRLSHQKNELLSQRLDAVIAALKKGHMRR